MAVETRTFQSSMSGSGQVSEAATPETLTLIAVFDGDRWASLCSELDIASDGQTSDEALWHLRAAVKEALAVAAEEGVAAGSPVPKDALLAFLEGHQGLDAVAMQGLYKVSL